MFTAPISAIAHKSAQNLVTEDVIIFGDRVLSRVCPHRYFPLGKLGKKCDKQITCKLHGFSFDTFTGRGVNNNLSLPQKQITPTKSGIVYDGDFQEPDHWWVDTIAKEKTMFYRDSFKGKSKGSWLWNYETALDLLHLRKDGIHPWLADQMTTDQVSLDEGDGWVLQHFAGGFWLFLFPYTFIEWMPGGICIVTVKPDSNDTEYGYSWFGQYYYRLGLPQKVIDDFKRIDEVWNEDVAASKLIRRPFTPMLKSDDPLERHNVVFGEWYKRNKI
jgi:nitrite reductase/ring-hydroxylating ferredoxin subunit